MSIHVADSFMISLQKESPPKHMYIDICIHICTKYVHTKFIRGFTMERVNPTKHVYIKIYIIHMYRCTYIAK